MRKWAPLCAVSLGSFMLLVDVTIVIVAMPDMADDLDASFTDLQWVLDGYSLALAAVLLAAGSLADRFGRRRMFVAGTVLFTASSGLCALAPDANLLIAARVLQGLGASAMFATTLALLGHAYQGRDRSTAIGVWGAVSAAAAAVGPLAGGLLTEHLGWEWIFLVNLPIGLLTAGLSLSVLTESQGDRAARPDVPGLLTFTAAVGLGTFGLIRAGGHGWGDATVLAVLGGGGLALIAFVAAERRSVHPMLDLGLFRSPAFTAVMVAGALSQFAAFACFPQVSVWLQSLIGSSPVAAGLTLVPMAATAFVVAGVAGRLLHGTHPRVPVGGGILLIGTGSFLLTAIDVDSGRWMLAPGLVTIGIGVGLAVPQIAGAALGAVPPHRAGMAGGALNTFRQLGFALGIAVVGVVFRATLEGRLDGATGISDPKSAAEAVGSGGASAVVAAAPPGTGEALREAIERAFVAGMDRVFALCGAVGVVAGVLVLLTVRPRPRWHP
ncbi:MFS transporter [Streptomyces sp. SID3343]|uniref:MFS transporter n=1 Tax=Streptomyces sp. SID3343 TaxID=2690260 RepID=UPI001369C3BC|nr:MFS transporter [Streptomyces sp. SID3343]MYV99626.1 DHA2 family efflux MFS transporter permease subunit [Streptomyces sp. SID3343]